MNNYIKTPINLNMKIATITVLSLNLTKLMNLTNLTNCIFIHIV